MVDFIDIKVPDTIEPASALVEEVFVDRGVWVQSGEELMTLIAGEKKINVVSPRTGVIMKVLAARGDSVSREAALIQLKGVNSERPSFYNAWRYFSQVKLNVSTVGKIFGGKVKQNIEISKKEDGKWTNACTIRMSYTLNRTGFPIQQGKYGAVSARDGMWYMYRVEDMLLYLRDVFGAPEIEINRAHVPDDFKGMKGILVVTGNGGRDSRGHITLWDGLKCADICYFPGEGSGNFSPRKAALWVLP